MQNYQDNLVGKVVGVLQPLAGVSVTVTNSGGALATIYSNETGTVQANPMTTDAQGAFGFYAPNGRYTLTFTGSKITTFTRSVELYDADDVLPVGAAALAAPTGASTIGATGGTTVQQEITDLKTTVSGFTTSNVNKVNGVGPDVSGNIALNTDNLPESGTPTNQWFTAARVRAVMLTGLSTATNAVVTAADSILTMAGKFQAQISANTTAIAGKINSTEKGAANGVAPLGADSKISATYLPPAGSLVFLDSATISSAVAQINFLNVLTSAYDKCIVEVDNLANDTSSTLSMTLASGGATITDATYGTMAADNVAATGSNTSLLLSSTASTQQATFTIEIRNTSSATFNTKTVGVRGTIGNRAIMREGLLSKAATISGFSLFPTAGGNLTGGTVRVYGVKGS